MKDRGKISRRKLAAFLGSLVFFGNAIPGSLTLCEDLVQIVSRPQFDWGATFELANVKRYLASAIRAFSRTSWCPLQKGMSNPVHLYTDATPSRVAYVWGDQMNAKDISRMPIYRAEAKAVSFLLEQKGLPSEFIIRTDNMALMHAMKKGRSPIPEARKVCRDILELRLKGHRIAVKYIPTDANPADWPSRHRFSVLGQTC